VPQVQEGVEAVQAVTAAVDAVRGRKGSMLQNSISAQKFQPNFNYQIFGQDPSKI
jgi:hypothetical protein